MTVSLREQIEQCQIFNWFPHFQQCSIKTRFVELPDDYVDFLLEDHVLERPEEAEGEGEVCL